MIHTKRTGWSVHDETMDDLGNNNGEKMAQAVRSGPAQLGQSHVPQALGLQPAPELLEGADWAGSLRSVGGTWKWRHGEEWRRVTTPRRLHCFVRVGWAGCLW